MQTDLWLEALEGYFNYISETLEECRTDFSPRAIEPWEHYLSNYYHAAAQQYLDQARLNG